jgi:hypothetical protein
MEARRALGIACDAASIDCARSALVWFLGLSPKPRIGSRRFVSAVFRPMRFHTIENRAK